MKYFTTTLLLALTVTTGAFAMQYDLHAPSTLESHQIKKHALKASAMPMKATPRHAAKESQTLEFTSFAMNFYNGAEFIYEGGSFSRYTTKITWYEDDAVSLENLFNLRAHGDGDTEAILWGTYDANRNVISIPTSESQLTEVGMMYGEITGYILAGEASEDLGFYPSEALELQLNDARNEIVTQQHVLVLEEYNGVISTHTAVKYIKMYRPHEGPTLAVFADDVISYKKPLFPGDSEKKSFYIANIGNASMEYVIDMEGNGDDSPFSLTSAASGTIRSMVMREIGFTYTPLQQGSDEANLTITTEDATWSALIQGSCEDYPDYSALVTEGEIFFRTGSQHPFAIGTIDFQTAGYSSTNYMTVGDSWLEAEVVVPAGQIGKLQWRGYSYIDYNWGAKSTIVADEDRILFESYMGKEIVNGHCQFAEGTHKVRFNFNATRPDFMSADDILVLHGFAFTTEPLQSDQVSLPNGNCLHFGNYVEQQQEPENTLRARLLNMGSNKLKCLSATDSEHFHVVVTDESASLLDTLYVSVLFNLSQAGTYNEDVVLNTTAGALTLHCDALVRTVPNYSQIVAADTDPSIPVTWRYSTRFPFIIDPSTLEAVNSNAREVDSVATTSWMEASFTIPDGKMGIVSWDGTLDMEGVNDEGTFHDYAMVFITHPGHQFGIIDIGQTDMGSASVYYKWQDGESLSQYFTAGENSIQWLVSHYGDSYYEGQDEMRISNLKIALEDYADYYCRPSVEEIDFGELLLGRTNNVTIQLTNLGGKELKIDSIVCDAPVHPLSVPDYSIPIKLSFDLKFAFEGLEAGEQEGAITIYTNAGEVIVLFNGNVIDPAGYLMAEDFEEAINWYRTDADKDGKCWNSLWNIYSTLSLGHCHSGEDGLGSSGYYYYMGDIDPDDWTYSPMVSIPTNGEYELSWWMGVDETDEDKYAHHYSVYIGEEMNRETLTQMYTEEIDGTGWKNHTLSLSEWKGKTICVAFRHFNSMGLGIMKLDDVYIRPVGSSNINIVKSNRCETEVYNLMGIRLPEAGKGLYIMRQGDTTRLICK